MNAAELMPNSSSAIRPNPGAVLAKATLRSADLLGLTGAALGRVLGLSEATVSRIGTGARGIDPGSKEGELAALLVRVYRSLDALVGNDEANRLRWLTSQNDALGGVPVRMLQSVQGLVRVGAYLDGMRARS